MKSIKILYWVGTGLLTAIMIFSIQMYFINTESIKATFIGLGYPSYLVYPLAVAKTLGLIAILLNFSKTLKEWAYAGFFFDIVLAFIAHLMIEDGGYLFSLVAFVALIISYFAGKKLRP
ncbi:DoxX family protein [Cellulophaga baltica]|uniref:DoxX family protein n=1 Tax=Cellulophaga TaxID=104264 RepID=UPI001C06FD50|nr:MULTISPECIES: DoxX family protein [Cellulophaga]MBU2995789.1 DoxX family protein [Cellulophaga baltica]MDO6767183.1 DoxX family protein [Cellulophaga sp. 1_MG-2023]